MSLPKPYYEESGITIYHADCRDVLPYLPPVDLVLTDPPYGIAHPTDYKTRGRGCNAATHDWPLVRGDEAEFDPSMLLTFDRVILWGANYYADKLPIVSGWLVWDKRVQQGKGVNDQADGEIAWSNCVKGIRIFRHMWNGYWRDSERGESYHPTQKPRALMKWCIRLVGNRTTILDPFMGSGTTLRAAKDLGLSAIGIEIEEKYCAIAVERLRQEVLPLTPMTSEVMDADRDSG